MIFTYDEDKFVAQYKLNQFYKFKSEGSTYFVDFEFVIIYPLL